MASSEKDMVVRKNVEVTTKQGIFREELVHFSPEEEEELIRKNVTKISGSNGDAVAEDRSLPSKAFFKADEPKMRFEHEIIDEFNGDKFTEAIQLLSDNRVLGMAVRGVKLSRIGKLSWIALATDNKAFLFDIKTMGEDAFKGLDEILGAQSVCKVVHDCRFISDYLYHRHGIQLRNVWDTQMASSVVFQNAHFGDPNRFLEPLNVCLVNYLGMAPDALPTLYKTEYTISDDSPTDEEMWEQRPLSAELIRYLVGEVMYLKDLKKILMEKMLDKFLTGVDVALELVKTAPDHYVKKLLTGSNLMPTKFL